MSHSLPFPSLGPLLVRPSLERDGTLDSKQHAHTSQCFLYYSAVTIGELPCTPFNQILDYVSAANAELSCVIQFDLADLDHGRGRFTLMKQNWELSQFKEITRISQSIADPVSLKQFGSERREREKLTFVAALAEPRRRMDYYLPREPRPSSLGHSLRLGCARAQGQC